MSPWPRRPPRPGRPVPRGIPLCVLPFDPDGSAVAQEEPGDERIGPDLRPAGEEGPAQRGHRVALGVDGAPEEGAEAAIVASRPSVVGNRVGAGRARVRVVPEPFGGGHREERPVHRRARWHGVRPRAGGGKRVRPGLAGYTHQPLGLGVEGLQILIGDGPVDDVGALHRSEQGTEAEIILPEPRQLAVGVHPAAADGGREVVHVAHVDRVSHRRTGSEGAGVEPGVGPEEMAVHELDLVVGVVGDQVVRGLELDQAVPPPLEDHHRATTGREHVGRGRPSRSRADDDDIEVPAHGWLTSSSLYPRGCTSPAKPMFSHPTRPWFPPYSGAPYMPWQACP